MTNPGRELISVYLDAEQIQQIDRIAQALEAQPGDLEVSRSAAIRWVCKKGIEVAQAELKLNGKK